ncbi:MAG TPA: PLP-dependent aminotransferase family protein [Ramlibacter sp.]|nr:PLP-dependent aminotransferase family protein [Ramlibacter sp.]
MKGFSTRSARVQVSAIRELLKLTERPGMVSLAGGLPSPALFPVDDVARAFDSVMRADATACLQYGPTEGLMGLREWVASQRSGPGDAITADNVLITTGSQQALDLIGKAFIDPGDEVLVENPSYLGALQALGLYEPVFRAFAEEGGQIDVARSGELAPDAQLAYVIPNFQNPTGRLMAQSTRVELARYSERHGLRLIEDDPYGEIRFAGEALPSLRSLCPDNTLYLGSFSKILAPGLRVGYVIAPAPVIRQLTLLKQAADLHTSSLDQKLVLALLQGGAFDKQVAAARRHYGQQARHMQEALAEHMPEGVRVASPTGGMFLWCELPEGLDAAELLTDALDYDMAFVPGAPFFISEPRANTLRLSYATATPEAMRKAVAVLGRLVRERVGALRG